MMYSIVIPVYNNAETLRETYNRIHAIFGQSPAFEVIFINDGSSDSSFSLLKSLQQHAQEIKILQLDKNYGQSIAIYAGFEYASGWYTILLSADLQEDSSLLEGYFEQSNRCNDIDLFIGYRKLNNDLIIFRYLSKIVYWLIRLKFPKMPIGGFDSVCIRSDLKRKFISNFHKDDFAQALLIELAENIRLIHYKRERSATPKIYMKSIFFKIRYFLNALVYIFLKPFTSKKKIVYHVVDSNF